MRYIEVADEYDEVARVTFSTDDDYGIWVTNNGEKCKLVEGNLRTLADLQVAARQFLDCFNEHTCKRDELFRQADDE